MNHTISVEKWLSQRLGVEVIELPQLPVREQLNKYDGAGSGVGFLLLLAMTSIDDESDNPETTHYGLLSVPIVKLRNTWMAIEDENLSDILAGVIRMVASEGINDGSEPEITEEITETTETEAEPEQSV
ncbi:MAG: hypothetical protein QF535_20290 [Anaerolineales bacterium]|jgi:hypothetical protein|nr:hypothetical protein [Anaerolineales bacterium]